MGWELDGSSVGRELKTGAGPSKRERRLSADIAYDVQRVLYRKWIIVAIEYLLKLAFFLGVVWLSWRGIKSLLPSQSAAPMPAPEIPAAPGIQEAAVGASTVLAFLLAILLLPVVTISFIRTMVSKRSNGVNALTLAIYTAADFILAFFMVGATLETTGKAVVFIGVGVFSLLYNFTVMNYALKLEDGR